MPASVLPEAIAVQPQPCSQIEAEEALKRFEEEAMNTKRLAFTAEEKQQIDEWCVTSFTRCQRLIAKASPKVLIIQESQWRLTALSIRLSRLGCNCHTARNGRDAFRYWEDQKGHLSPFDAVIIDREMDWIGGIEFVRMVRQHQKQAQCAPISVIATCRGRDHPVKVIKEGFDHFIKLPLALHSQNLAHLLLPEYLHDQARISLFSKKPHYDKIMDVFDTMTQLNEAIQRQLQSVMSENQIDTTQLEDLIVALKGKCAALEHELRISQNRDTGEAGSHMRLLRDEVAKLKKENTILTVTNRKFLKTPGLYRKGWRGADEEDESEGIIGQLQNEKETLQNDVEFLANRYKLNPATMNNAGKKISSVISNKSKVAAVKVAPQTQTPIVAPQRWQRRFEVLQARTEARECSFMWEEDRYNMPAEQPQTFTELTPEQRKEQDDLPSFARIRRYGEEIWAPAREASKVCIVENELRDFLAKITSTVIGKPLADMAHNTHDYHSQVDRSFVLLLSQVRKLTLKKGMDAGQVLKAVWGYLARFTTKLEQLELAFVSLFRDVSTQLAAGFMKNERGQNSTISKEILDELERERQEADALAREAESEEIPTTGTSDTERKMRKVNMGVKFESLLKRKVEALEKDYNEKNAMAKGRETQLNTRYNDLENEHVSLKDQLAQKEQVLLEVLTLQQNTYRVAQALHRTRTMSPLSTPAERTTNLADIYRKMKIVTDTHLNGHIRPEDNSRLKMGVMDMEVPKEDPEVPLFYSTEQGTQTESDESFLEDVINQQARAAAMTAPNTPSISDDSRPPTGEKEPIPHTGYEEEETPPAVVEEEPVEEQIRQNSRNDDHRNFPTKRESPRRSVGRMKLSAAAAAVRAFKGYGAHYAGIAEDEPRIEEEPIPPANGPWKNRKAMRTPKIEFKLPGLPEMGGKTSPPPEMEASVAKYSRVLSAQRKAYNPLFDRPRPSPAEETNIKSQIEAERNNFTKTWNDLRESRLSPHRQRSKKHASPKEDERNLKDIMDAMMNTKEGELVRDKSLEIIKKKKVDNKTTNRPASDPEAQPLRPYGHQGIDTRGMQQDSRRDKSLLRASLPSALDISFGATVKNDDIASALMKFRPPEVQEMEDPESVIRSFNSLFGVKKKTKKVKPAADGSAVETGAAAEEEEEETGVLAFKTVDKCRSMKDMDVLRNKAQNKVNNDGIATALAGFGAVYGGQTNTAMAPLIPKPPVSNPNTRTRTTVLQGGLQYATETVLHAFETPDRKLPPLSQYAQAKSTKLAWSGEIQGHVVYQMQELY